jgi:hypothetical protein
MTRIPCLLAASGLAVAALLSAAVGLISPANAQTFSSAVKVIGDSGMDVGLTKLPSDHAAGGRPMAARIMASSSVSAVVPAGNRCRMS